MHLYSVGYGTCEESSYREFRHADKLSNMQLEDIVAKCMAQAYIKEQKKRAKEEFSHNFIIPTIQDLMPNNLYFLQAMKNFGFEQVKYTASLGVFGWGSVLDPDDWPTYRSSTDVRIIKKTNKIINEEQKKTTKDS